MQPRAFRTLIQTLFAVPLLCGCYYRPSDVVRGNVRLASPPSVVLPARPHSAVGLAATMGALPSFEASGDRLLDPDSIREPLHVRMTPVLAGGAVHFGSGWIQLHLDADAEGFLMSPGLAIRVMDATGLVHFGWGFRTMQEELLLRRPHVQYYDDTSSAVYDYTETSGGVIFPSVGRYGVALSLRQSARISPFASLMIQRNPMIGDNGLFRVLSVGTLSDPQSLYVGYATVDAGARIRLSSHFDLQPSVGLVHLTGDDVNRYKMRLGLKLEWVSRGMDLTTASW